jgi:hypothetical protein
LLVKETACSSAKYGSASLSANDDLERLLKDGVEAARRGDRATARKLLEQVVSLDEDNELAWIWLASTVNTLSERRACLQKVLQINPNNARAREALQNLGSTGERDDESRKIEQLRQLQRSGATPRSTARAIPDEPVRSTNPLYLVLLLLLGGAVVAAVLIGPSLFQQVQPTPTLNAFELALNATTGPTNTPPPTLTLFVVSPETRTAPTLPPTFTATPTETATVTPTPTATPYPLELFAALLVSSSLGDTEPSLYSLNGDGTDERLTTADVREIAYDPAGEKVAFVRDVEYAAEGDLPAVSAPEIFVAPASDLNAAVQITTLRAERSGSPSWAPDGVQIAFVSDYDGDEEIWTMTSDGQNVTQITANDGAIDRDPAWSPDGSTIVYASDASSPGQTEIFSVVVPISEGDAPVITRLTDDAGSSYAPAWSPTGEMLAFISDRSGDGDVYTMDATGQRTRLLTADDGGAEDRRPTFTPDGRWVVFISNREDDIFQTYLVNLRGSELVRLTNNGRDDQAIVFRPELLLRLREEE